MAYLLNKISSREWMREEWMNEWMNECPHGPTTPWISLTLAVPQRVHSLKAGRVPWQLFPLWQRLAPGELWIRLAGSTMTQDIAGQGKELRYLADPLQTHTFNHLDSFTVIKFILQPDGNIEKDHWQRRVSPWISMPSEVWQHSKLPNEPETPGGPFPGPLQFYRGISLVHWMESVC